MTETNKNKDTNTQGVDGKGAEKTKEKQVRKRVPLGTRNILTAPKRPGFVRRFVNDKGDRIQRFKDAGYSIVEEQTQVGDPKIGRSSQLGSDVRPHVGSGMRAVLMEISEEYYNEDFKASQDKISKIENEIQRKPGKESSDGLSGNVSIS
ncbi:MAG: hypothetical protein SVO01_00195 [Thermotogota bacterium]|nr:hypothetical protein [Thermotogota bacterium]